MKAQLLRRLRKEFRISQRGNLWMYRRYFNTFDGPGYIDSEWSNNKEDILRRRRDEILEYARDNYRKPKNNKQLQGI